jgi:hypothetical protein
VGIEIVHYHSDDLSIGLLFVHQPFHPLGKVNHRWVLHYLNMAPTGLRLAEHARESCGGSSHRASSGPPPRQPAQREADTPKEGKAAKVGGFLKKVGGLLQKKP